MDAKLKKVSITPAKFDDECAIKADECDSRSTCQWIPRTMQSQRELMKLLDAEWIVVEFKANLRS